MFHVKHGFENRQLLLTAEPRRSAKTTTRSYEVLVFSASESVARRWRAMLADPGDVQPWPVRTPWRKLCRNMQRTWGSAWGCRWSLWGGRVETRHSARSCA
jgi:hypothetical protein